MKILYLGQNSGTSRHRFEALKRIGHNVFQLDPYAPLKASQWLAMWSFKTGGLGLENQILRYVLKAIGEDRFDLIWVDNGELVGARLARELKARTRVLLNHNLDNPFTARDGQRWRLFLKALPVYDLFVTPRQSTVEHALSLGAQRAIKIVQSADEIVHRRSDSAPHRNAPPLDVVFVGTWMPERGPFMLRLLARGVPLRIFGPRWTKAPEFSALRAIARTELMGDRAYVDVISRSKIGLCLLSSGNEDLHTTRSLEIPAIGALLCAPRTSDHLLLYEEGIEACFFDNADECADICVSLLADETKRQSIADCGHKRALHNNRFNQVVIDEILKLAQA
jgi:spore maturation protein CgeB